MRASAHAPYRKRYACGGAPIPHASHLHPYKGVMRHPYRDVICHPYRGGMPHPSKGGIAHPYKGEVLLPNKYHIHTIETTVCPATCQAKMPRCFALTLSKKPSV